jgi:uncharacterized membrane protein YeiH
LVEHIPPDVLMLRDAAGLSLFVIADTEKAMLFKMHPFIAVLLGTLTAVGGGSIRDILLMHVPRVLQADVYATAALAGAVVMVLATRLRLYPALAAVLGRLLCFLLRVFSVWYRWSLPKVTGP